MSTKSPQERRRPYHHGSTREAAISEAIRLLGAGGSDAVSLRAVARGVGVDHAAIHQCFRGKTNLLIAVAASCYDELGRAMERASRRAEAMPLAQVTAIALAFVWFATKNPGKIGLLSRPDMNSEALADSTLAAAHDRVLGLLLRVVREGQDEGVFASEPPSQLAFVLWAFCLGYWENYRTRRGFDGSVPLADAGWLAVRRHFLATFSLVVRGILVHPDSSSGDNQSK